MGQFSNSFPKLFSYLCEYAFRFDLSCIFCEYPFIFHCLHCSPSCFDPDSLLLAHLWLGLSWIYCISANKSFSSPKTSSRKPYTSSKQQERQKHSAETTINFSQCAPAPRNQERAVFWATWLKNEFRGHLVHPQPPTFYGFQASKSRNDPRRPPYQWSLGAAGGPASPRTVGAKGGSTRVPGAKKIISSKVVPRPLGMLKQVFLGRLEPVVARFGSWKIPKCLENGPFWDQQWVKNGSKTRFSKNDPGPFMMLKQVVLAHIEPVATGFGPWKTPKCLENGPFWDQKWVKNGSKMRFSKRDPGPFGMLK